MKCDVVKGCALEAGHTEPHTGPYRREMFPPRCRTTKAKSPGWIDLVESGYDDNEVSLAILNAYKELCEDQELLITELRAVISSLQHSTV